MRPGPQPPACVVQDCTNPPARFDEVYCDGHKAFFARQNGTAVTPPIVQPDDPGLLEREAAKAAAQEEREYAERRRVKTWKTQENGSRVPETYWTDEELAAIEAQAAEALNTNLKIIGSEMDLLADARSGASHTTIPWDRGMPAEDPERAALKVLKRALRGKLGDAAGKAAWGLVEMFEGGPVSDAPMPSDPALIADYGRLRTACSAVLYGSIWDGFNGPTGVSKDEALEYAAELAEWVLTQIQVSR